MTAGIADRSHTAAQALKPCVVIADDDPSITSFLKGWLQNFDLDAHFVSDGRAAVYAARRLLPDLFLLDVDMPVMNGLQAALEIRRPGGRRCSGATVERYFQLARHGTTARTEWVAGLTTFVTMAYILFVNPAIMAAAGLDHEALVIGTIFAAVVPTAAMALWARLPWALAPGMGYNALFAYTVVAQYHLAPSTA